MEDKLSSHIPTQGWDAVVLLHGLFATRRSMRKAQSLLEHNGYLAINWGYSTFRKTIDCHADSLLPILRRLSQDEHIRSINFLAHSFGSIILRYALQLESIAKTRRAVMLAPPNSGSPLAKYSVGPFARLFPIIGQISEAPDSLPNRLRPPGDLDVGIIAASSDFIVRVRNTFLQTQSDHCVVPSTHFELPNHEGALAKSIQFLTNGCFERPVTHLKPAVAMMPVAA
ncbi:MAG: alpha/beta hydrolase [bacterium]|nr:alpha/beta hydrolase [bacterium]